MFLPLLYGVLVALFSIAYFFIFKAIKIEKYFEKGHLTEIRLAYFLFSITLGFITTLGVWKFVELIESLF